MKILKIEFQNINSLKDTHLIDFTKAPFTVSSLFAITGPTGSGKSTILDVISLALFNQVPRLGKISRNEILSKGAILTRNQKEAFARVTYESKHGVFTSHWSISTARTGTLRDYEMEISEESTGNILDLKKSDVPSKNEELIGLNYNQFIKAVLLAQGEFAQFLRARKDERGELLEKITGTGIYRQLGKMAFEKFKLVNQEIKKQQDAIGIIEQELLTGEQLVDFTEELAGKENICKPLENEIKALDKNLELKKTIGEQLNEIDKIAAEKESADLSLEEFIREYGTSLEHHEKVRDVAGDLREWSRLTKECAGLDEEFRGKKDRKNANVLELEKCLKEVSGFTKLEVAQEEVEVRLEEFSRKVRELQEELNGKVSDYKNLQQQFQVETRDVSCQLDDKNPETNLDKLKQVRKDSEENIEELQAGLQGVNLQEPEAEKMRLKYQLKEAREAQEQSEKADRICAEIRRLLAEAEKLEPKIKELPKEIRHGEDQVKIYRERLEKIGFQKQNQILLSSLEDHRSGLKKGEPCPLCGSKEHPYAEVLPPKNDDLDREMQETEQALSTWNHKLTGNVTTLKHYEKNLSEITEQKQNQEEQLKRQEKELNEKYKHLKTVEDLGWRKLCENLESLLENLEQYQKENRNLECVATGIPLIEKMLQISSQGKELRENLLEIYTGKDIHEDTQKFRTRWTKTRELEKAIDEQLLELQGKIDYTGKELKDLEGALTVKITGKGFENIAKAGEALLPDAEYYKLGSQRDKIEKEIAKNQHSLKLLTSQLEKSKAQDVEETVEELTKQRQEKNSRLESLQKECQHLNRVLLNDRDNREKLHKIKEEIAEKEKNIKRWRLLNELIGDSTGKKFNDFAQDLSLSQLLQLANVRLKDLSDRYRIGKPAEDEDDGLVAIDEHMGGQRRSVKTLSGGETFILSLSMALALSDLASKNVEINSLFIDEGFGTLDPETLDQTLDTLEKLQAESSKTIGIISHVDSLKERIATQIQLKRSGQGYSSLEVK